jgi:hypothetical protein
MSVLKIINFHKSEIFCFGNAKEIDYLYADIFTCPIGNLPMKYLGVPIDNKKINKSLWVPMIEKLEKRLVGWQGRSLSLGGRLTLLNSCISNVPLYMLSIYPAPKSVIKKLIFLGGVFSGKEVVSPKNFIWWIGCRCALPKVREVWVF